MRVVRSPHAHAAFALGDLAALRARWPGIVDVLTAADVPNNAFAIFPDLRDQPVLADGVARFRGEAVLALVGDAATPCRDRRRRACRSATTPLPAPETPADALAAAGRGARCTRAIPTTCSAAAASSAATSTRRSPLRRTSPSAAFETRHVEHAYIEPEAGYAEIVDGVDASGAPLAGPHLRLHADALHGPRRDRARARVAPEQVHIVPSAIGGGFGGKLDLSVQPLLAVAAWKLGRPVRLVYERPESMQSSTKRHPAEMQRERGVRRRRPARRVRFHRRLQHRRLFVVGADGRQPRADPRHRPVPRRRTCAR